MPDSNNNAKHFARSSVAVKVNALTGLIAIAVVNDKSDIGCFANQENRGLLLVSLGGSKECRPIPLTSKSPTLKKRSPNQRIQMPPVVVFYDGTAKGWFKSVVDAYLWAKDRFPANQYLVRDVNEEAPFLPLLV